MLHPSYSEIIQAVNRDAEEGDQLVQSRYSIVIATAKRAREIIKENKLGLKKKKALSIAIDEIYNQKVKIILGEDSDSVPNVEDGDVEEIQEEAEITVVSDEADDADVSAGIADMEE